MNQQLVASQAIEALRNGIPPQRGTQLYSVGHEKLIDGIKKFHLSQIGEVGKIRFVSGSWGAGKTHFFRLLREVALEHGCLVSNVELSVNEAPFNKFERVFYSIVRKVTTPSGYQAGTQSLSTPFAAVVQEALSRLGGVETGNANEITYEVVNRAYEKLMANKGIDIDFKKIIHEYWKTFVAEAAEKGIVDQTRAEILQWFAGEGSLATYRKRFGANKMVSRENAKLMLQSLAEFVKISGYKGLLILFDEAEQSYSPFTMRMSALRDAHNNLLHLINTIETLPGMFLIYATTPEFYTDHKRGIVIYGALAQRIGKPEDHIPKALDTIWNLDAVTPKLEDYREAARKIRALYAQAYQPDGSQLPDEKETAKIVDHLYEQHPSLSAIRFWRVLVAGLVRVFDNSMEGVTYTVPQLYNDVMDRLRED